MFEFPLRRTYELILEQLSQARHKGKANFKVSVHLNTPKMVFLTHDTYLHLL
jgi:hypothetical protein